MTTTREKPSDVAALAMKLLWGGEVSVLDKLGPAVGQRIVDVVISEKMLKLKFPRGASAEIWDGGQSCCEHRYMHTDDDLSKYMGAGFLGAAVRSGGRDEVDGERKDSEFLLIWTTVGVLTVVNYNEHNGYYGGFSIESEVHLHAEESDGARVSEQG